MADPTPDLNSAPAATPAPATPAAAPAASPAAPTATPEAAPATAPAAPTVAAAATPVPTSDTPNYLQDATSVYQNSKTAYQNAQKLAQPTPAAPPPPHARLLAMVQGLSIGLSAFGTAMATKGKEGGAPEVQQFYAQQQQQELQKQEAATAQKNAQIQQQIMVGNTAKTVGDIAHMLYTLPDEISKSHLEVSGEQQRQNVVQADFAASHGGMTPEQFNGAISGTVPTAPAAAPDAAAPAGAPAAGGVNQFFKTSAQQVLDAATKSLGADDSYVKNLQTVLANPQATAKDLWTAKSQLEAQQDLQDKATKRQQDAANAKKDIQAADPLYKLETDPTEMQGDKSTSALALLNTKLSNEKDPVQVARINRLIGQAKASHAGYLSDKQSEETARQIAEQGSPEVAGQALFDGILTLADLKSRNVTPKFIVDATNAAQKIAQKSGQVYNASDEVVGERLLGQAGTQAFFASGHSLLGPDGTLAQLKKAGDEIPQNQFPTANTAQDWATIKAGGGAPAGYAATLLGVADDYGKVMGGGSATDSARYSAEALAAMSASPDARAAAIEGIRRSVESQLNARIGTNRYVRQREGYDLPASGTGGHQVGDAVKLKNGSTVIIKSINPKTGTFTY